MSNETSLNRIDSEIALTALLSAAVMGYPMSDLSVYPAVKVVAFGLLVLTLARRTGIVNGLTDEDAVIRATTYLMDPATYISFLYLVYVLVNRIQNSIPGQSNFDIVLFSIFAGSLAFGLFLVSELLFDAPLNEGERIFEASAQQHRGEAFGILLAQFADYVGSSSPKQVDKGQQVALTDSRFDNRSPEDYTGEELLYAVFSTVVMLAALGFAVAGYVLLIAVGQWLFDIGWLSAISLLFAVVLVSALFRIWYSNYGLVQVENKNGYFSFIGDAVAYLVTILIVV
jgi:hypothetical protein